METIKEARDYIADNVKEGVSCPCCNQLVKKYYRPMHSMLGVALIGLYRKNNVEENYYHISDFAEYRGIGDFAKLRYWGFIEQRPKNENEDHKRTSGYWKITEKGKAFVENEISVPSHIVLLNGKYCGTYGTPVTIKQVLKKNFNYLEIMNG